jgi:hypothetical protein
MESRLGLPIDIGCSWQVLEVREGDGLLAMKKMIDSYLTRTVNG